MRETDQELTRNFFPQLTEKQKLLKMEKTLRREVVGQEKAVTAVANAIRLNRSGLSNQDRPIASFLFVGPSGTGKTQLAKALAKFLFDTPDAMLRIDASEYVSAIPVCQGEADPLTPSPPPVCRARSTPSLASLDLLPVISAIQRAASSPSTSAGSRTRSC